MKHNKKSFKYAGVTFTPVKRLTDKQLNLRAISPFLRSDRKLNLSTYAKTYTYEDFYNACGEKYYDLFRCEDNEKIYIPCDNELFEYTKKI